MDPRPRFVLICSENSSLAVFWEIHSTFLSRTSSFVSSQCKKNEILLRDVDMFGEHVTTHERRSIEYLMSAKIAKSISLPVVDLTSGIHRKSHDRTNGYVKYVFHFMCRPVQMVDTIDYVSERILNWLAFDAVRGKNVVIVLLTHSVYKRRSRPKNENTKS